MNLKNEVVERNAVIRNAQITNADRGCLTIWLDLDYGDSGQGFGGYSLFTPKKSKETLHTSGGFCGHFIWRVLEIAGVNDWSDLPGRTIRVLAAHSKVHAIGHILNDDWFNPAEDFAND